MGILVGGMVDFMLPGFFACRPLRGNYAVWGGSCRFLLGVMVLPAVIAFEQEVIGKRSR